MVIECVNNKARRGGFEGIDYGVFFAEIILIVFEIVNRGATLVTLAIEEDVGIDIGELGELEFRKCRIRENGAPLFGNALASSTRFEG